ncbi:hypothetical protein V8C43DRAFT_297472 [Trichoderma afarasin]
MRWDWTLEPCREPAAVPAKPRPFELNMLARAQFGSAQSSIRAAIIICPLFITSPRGEAQSIDTGDDSKMVRTLP